MIYGGHSKPCQRHYRGRTLQCTLHRGQASIPEAIHYSVHCTEVRHIYQRPHTTVYIVLRSSIFIPEAVQCTEVKHLDTRGRTCVQRSSIFIPEDVQCSEVKHLYTRGHTVYRGQASLYQRLYTTVYTVQRSGISTRGCTVYRGQASIPEAVQCTEVRHIYQRGCKEHRGQAYLP